jgi:hypothetical protein
MGQYHYVCNIDKREFLHPHKFGDGLKLMEFGPSPSGTMMGLALLLAASNGRGGGDWHAWVDGVGYHSADTYGADRTLDVDKATAEQLSAEVPGRWAADRIAIYGDYCEPTDKGVDVAGTPWGDDKGWTDISEMVLAAMKLDYYLAQDVRAAW